MKQGNSESDQTPDFVCFRKVVYAQGEPPEFRMFSKKLRIFEGKNRIFEKKNQIFEKKSEKKNRDFVFPTMFHNNLKKKIVNGHGAIISSSP